MIRLWIEKRNQQTNVI